MAIPGSMVTLSTTALPPIRAGTMQQKDLSSCRAMRDGHGRGLDERLVYDAVALRQLQQLGDLFRRRCRLQVEVQADLTEADRHVLGDAQGPPKVEVALGGHRAAVDGDAE